MAPRTALVLLFALAGLLGSGVCLASAAQGARSIYWTDNQTNAVRVGHLTGSGASNLFNGEVEPQGVAIDRSAGKIYWASDHTGPIRVGRIAAGSSR